MRKILLPSAAVVLATLIVVSVWYFTRGGDGNHSKSNTSNQTLHQLDSAAIEAVKTRTEFDYGSTPAKRGESFDPFTPEHAILNLECKMLSGKGSANDVALVTLPTEDGVVFAVIGEFGELARGELDIRPNHLRIGHRTDGSVVYGLGDLRLNSKVFRPRDSAEPVRIYQDEYLIYESAKAWDFDIAADGSSFFVHEPSAGGTSRLIVRNLDRGTQVEYDLSTRLTPVSDYSSDHAPGYSHDASEIVFTPAHADAMGRGVYWFYPVGDGRKRQVTIDGFWSVLLTSSENGYFIDHPDNIDPDEFGDVWQISRRRLDPKLGKSEELWSVKTNVRKFGGLMSLSENGKWLGLRGWDYKVLNTETGETIFDFPYAGKPNEQLARLTPILVEGATVEDIGTHGHMSFKGNYLVGYRMWGTTSWCSQKPGEKYDRVKERECIRESRLLGKLKESFDVYDMNSIELSGSPTYTTEVYSESNCIPASPGWKGLVNLDGKLAFQPVPPPMETVDTP